MLCDRCRKREAKIFYTEIVKGVRKEQHLCEECATETTSFNLNGEDLEETIENLLTTLLSNYIEDDDDEMKETEEKECTNCHMGFDEFLDGGKFGCSNCYEAFKEYLPKIFKSIQGADTHIGKQPQRTGKTTDEIIRNMSKIDWLSIKLEEAIEKEDYEQAALLRDQIKELKDQ